MQSWHGWGMRRGCPDIQLFRSPVTIWSEWWPKSPFSNPPQGNMTEGLNSASPGCQNKILTQRAPSVRTLQMVENIPGTLKIFESSRGGSTANRCWARWCSKSVTQPEAQGVSVDAELYVVATRTSYEVLYQQGVALLTTSVLLCRCIVRGLYVSWEYLEPPSSGCPSCWESPLLTLWATSSSKQTTTTSPLDSMVLSWHHISSSKACLPS